MKKIVVTVLVVILAGAVLFGLIQLIPYGRNHTNPPVVQEPKWDSTQTRDLAVRACFDCHSNETAWPWYTSVAPVSWLTQRDVDEGRRRLNFSEWAGATRRTNEIARQVSEGEMPMPIYLVMHPSARLTQAETDALVQGLQNSLK